MKIEVIKPQEEVKWSYPCKGVANDGSGLVVGFSYNGRGVVIDKGKSPFNLYNYFDDWDMNTFTPIDEKEKKQGNNLNWNKVKFPILAQGITKGDVFLVEGIDEVDSSVCLTTFSTSGKVHYICEDREKFSSKLEMERWLKSLEILPEGTEIKITI